MQSRRFGKTLFQLPKLVREFVLVQYRLYVRRRQRLRQLDPTFAPSNIRAVFHESDMICSINAHRDDEQAWPPIVKPLLDGHFRKNVQARQRLQCRELGNFENFFRDRVLLNFEFGFDELLCLSLLPERLAVGGQLRRVLMKARRQ